MHDQPDPGARRRIRRDQTSEPSLLIGAKAGQASQAAAVGRRRNCGLMAGGLQGDTGAWSYICQPACLARILDVVELGNQMMTGAAPLEIWLTVSLQIFRAGV